jgi:hypothetical protein
MAADGDLAASMANLCLKEERADVHFRVVVQLGDLGGEEADTKVSAFYVYLTE